MPVNIDFMEKAISEFLLRGQKVILNTIPERHGEIASLWRGNGKLCQPRFNHNLLRMRMLEYIKYT